MPATLYLALELLQLSIIKENSTGVVAAKINSTVGIRNAF